MSADALKVLIERHVATLRGNADIIRHQLDLVWQGGPERGPAAARAVDVAHQMAGAGGSIGFRPVSVAAKTLETELKPLAAGGIADRPAIERLLGELRALVASLTPEQSSLYNVDITRIAGPQRRVAP